MLTWLGLHLVYKVLGLLAWLGAVLTYKPQSNDNAVSIKPVKNIPEMHSGLKSIMLNMNFIKISTNLPHREQHENPSFNHN